MAKRSSKKRRRRKRCSCCGELVTPDPRVGKRQKYCSTEACQRARKRDYQRKFRREHPAEDRGRRLRQKLAAVESGDVPPPSPRPPDPLAGIPWDEITEEVGIRAATVGHLALDYTVQLLNQLEPRSRDP